MIDAIRLKSTAQAMLTCVLNAGFLPLAIYQSTEMKGRIDSLKGSIDANRQPIVHLEIPIWEQIGGMLRAMPYIVGICTGLLVVSVWYLKQYFDWQAYRNVGADAKLRRIRTIHQVCYVRYSCQTQTDACRSLSCLQKQTSTSSSPSKSTLA